MFKNTVKLLGILLLLTISFIYTDKVFSIAKESSTLMKQVISYKEKNDVLPTEAKITGDEMILGYSGVMVNKEESYKNMKKINKFLEEKIVYDKVLPKNTITKTYDYYIKKGNPSLKKVAIIYKVKDSANLDEILKKANKSNVNITFFVDGSWLEKNVDKAFLMVNSNHNIYNLGYDGIYDKSYISKTNSLIESITLNDSKYCLNENKNDEYKKLCKKKKMHSITPTLINPDIKAIKENLDEGIIISYDLNDYDVNLFNTMVNLIIQKGYKISPLSDVLDEVIN